MALVNAAFHDRAADRQPAQQRDSINHQLGRIQVEILQLRRDRRLMLERMEPADELSMDGA